MSPRRRRSAPSTAAASRQPKIQRWIDLIAALLRRRYGATFEELRSDVPAYAEDKGRDTILRMFERDKDELRELGVAIETVSDEEGEPASYLLRRRNFYLPYLLAPSARGAREETQRTGPARAPERAGYRDLPRLAFEPDELAAVADAAERVRQLGDPLLADHAESAIRKLAFDLPVGALAATAPVRVVPGRSSGDVRAFEVLDGALRRRKRVRFVYRSPERDASERRDVEPYGLFFLGGNWYLAAFDRAREGLRNFRLNRIADVEVNARREGTPDYEIPATFDLRDHARSRQAWELGDRDAMEAVVRFRIVDGATAAAARLGDAADGDAITRRFRVRRLAPFVRWLVSFAGNAVPVSPPALVEAYRTCVRETLSIYDLPRPPARRGVRATPVSKRSRGSRQKGRG